MRWKASRTGVPADVQLAGDLGIHNILTRFKGQIKNIGLDVFIGLLLEYYCRRFIRIPFEKFVRD